MKAMPSCRCRRPISHRVRKKPRKPRPSKSRVTQKKNDARHADEVAAWEAECARIDARNSALTAEWETPNKAHLQAARRARHEWRDGRDYNAAM